MALPNPLYVYCPPPQIYFVDKDSGDPLSAGVVTFYSDVNRTTLKSIYKQVQLSDNTYEFVEIANPVTLTSVGTFGDDEGNDIDIYLYPYENAPSDADTGAIELYYLTVYSSGLVLQFTREAWPPNVIDPSGETSIFTPTANELANPQFVEVLFVNDVGSTSKVFTVSSGTTTIPIAPAWDLIAVASVSGTVTVSQATSIPTTVNSNPPYALNIASTGLSSIYLRQRLSASPRLLYAGTDGSNGIPAINGFFVAKSVNPSGLAEFTMTYSPDTGGSVTLVDQLSTVSDVYEKFSGTESLDGVGNSTAAPTGYVDVTLAWTANTNIEISSLQIVGVANTNSSVEFIQQSTAMQKNGLSYYYKPQLAFKPIPSYTIGWDFPYNPTQALGPSVGASGLAANKSRYIADQTIAFEAVGNSMTYVFNAHSGLSATATNAASQFAIVQYLDSATATDLIDGKMAVNVNAAYGFPDDLTGYVNLYYTEDATLPDIKAGTNNSLVSALTAGVPTAGNGTWVKIPRSNLEEASFTITNTGFTDYPFSGWDASSIPPPITATFFAIVVSFTELALSTQMSIASCSLCKGDIATQPPATNKAETLQALQYYYQKSFDPDVVPAQAAGEGQGQVWFPQTTAVGTACAIPVNFVTPLGVSPVITGYSPINTNGSAYNKTVGVDCGTTTVQNASQNSFWLQVVPAAGSAVGNLLGIQWTADARLGTY